MPVIITIQCDGQDGACSAQLQRTGRSLSAAELAARGAGWSIRKSVPLCPACAPASHRGCYRCSFYSEFSDAMGHDQLGHRTVNKLASEGVTTWAQLRVLSRERLRFIEGLGLTAVGRVEHALQGRDN
ncbi:hypothetical protein AB0M39_41810 [Streptomyces sp. NPDC051907]|uniref:hypothetical protein n=1 Tax=Streptomyces sp. NPDC051907 TaxID=3155284 RepID=UPI0034196F4A